MSTTAHFVSSYEKLVADLCARLPLDEAMAKAVGGDYERVGDIEADILEELGLRAGHAVVDLGCGSGRLAAALGRRIESGIDYLGIDIVQALLDYARSKSPPGYRFVRNCRLDLPCPDASADFVVAFSVFTHLHKAESAAYLSEARRVLRPGGLMIFSTLMLKTYLRGLPSRLLGRTPHLNTYVSAADVRRWTRACGFESVRTIPPRRLGQTVTALRR